MALVVLRLVDRAGDADGVDFTAEFTPRLADVWTGDQPEHTAAQAIGLELLGRIAELVSDELVSVDPTHPQEG